LLDWEMFFDWALLDKERSTLLRIPVRPSRASQQLRRQEIGARGKWPKNKMSETIKSETGIGHFFGFLDMSVSEIVHSSILVFGLFLFRTFWCRAFFRTFRFSDILVFGHFAPSAINRWWHVQLDVRDNLC
jgi:hypothetical protein